ncbi:MAG: leucine-rich repeat domain-containing protein [Chloroflexota bacterium]|nr:leucine-rich repeat domain-containing protein [Chloroflexota bacterium]
MRIPRTFSLAIMLVALLALLLYPPVVVADELVVFPDPNLEVAIREAIGKPAGDISRSDLDALTMFSAEAKGISDLTGMEYCTSLSSISLWGNRISDLSPLSNLTNLNSLYLGQNQISDISPLSTVNSLIVLNVGGNQISDISPLSDLASLMYLYMTYNQISDISPLSELNNLADLWLSHNQIADIAPLVANSGLGDGDKVYLVGNPLSTTSLDVHVADLEQRGVIVMLTGSPPPTPVPTATPTLAATATPEPTPTSVPTTAGNATPPLTDGDSNVWGVLGPVLAVLVFGLLAYYVLTAQRARRRG